MLRVTKVSSEVEYTVGLEVSVFSIAIAIPILISQLYQRIVIATCWFV